MLPGRPFAIELVNPRRIHFTAEEMKELQQVNHLHLMELIKHVFLLEESSFAN